MHYFNSIIYQRRGTPISSKHLYSYQNGYQGPTLWTLRVQTTPKPEHIQWNSMHPLERNQSSCV